MVMEDLTNMNCQSKVIFECGAAVHLTGASELLIDGKPCEKELSLPNGSIMAERMRGNILSETMGIVRKKILLTNVVYVEGIRRNLLSLVVLERKGLSL